MTEAEKERVAQLYLEHILIERLTKEQLEDVDFILSELAKTLKEAAE